MEGVAGHGEGVEGHPQGSFQTPPISLQSDVLCFFGSVFRGILMNMQYVFQANLRNILQYRMLIIMSIHSFVVCWRVTRLIEGVRIINQGEIKLGNQI